MHKQIGELIVNTFTPVRYTGQTFSVFISLVNNTAVPKLFLTIIEITALTRCNSTLRFSKITSYYHPNLYSNLTIRLTITEFLLCILFLPFWHISSKVRIIEASSEVDIND